MPAPTKESVYTSISPALHPNNVDALEGYDDETKGYVNGVTESLSTAYEGIANIHAARLAAAKNPTMNDSGKLLVTAKYAEQQQATIALKVDRTMADLDSGIKSMEDMLSTPLTSAATTGSLPNEIRQHVKGLTASQRNKFLTDAQKANDVTTLSAVLGAPAYLSGILPAEKVARTRFYHEAKSPVTVARLEVMKRGRDLLVERSALVFNEVENAIGGSWDKVRQVRELAAASDKAFAVK